ncbi:MAG: DUF4129 domain-containing protein, partial [Pyrinomonadaceae bacterium]|nr:DUF4129 domain-containing protein [Pyrinomonadaceae bacterium]
FSGLVDERIRSIRRSIPRNETIDIPQGVVETNNVWLHDELDLYEKETNISKRDVIARRIIERLLGIEAGIAELNAAAAGAASKDAEKQKLAEILRRPEYQKPADAGESLFQKWRREFLEWLAKMFPRVAIEPSEPSGTSSLSIILQVLLYSLLALGLGYLLYRFLPFFSTRFGGRKGKAEGDRIILGERVAADQTAADLFAEAERFARDGELRLAIRKGYVALLCELADRKVIGLARHKTNRDYLVDMRKKTDLFEGMKRLTTSFERHWYGAQTADRQEWEDFCERYKKLVGGA